MTSEQAAVDHVVAELASRAPGDRVELTTDAGSYDCRVERIETGRDRLAVSLVRADGTPLVVTSERQFGWLDPLVDAITGDGYRIPLGTLHVVAGAGTNAGRCWPEEVRDGDHLDGVR